MTSTIAPGLSAAIDQGLATVRSSAGAVDGSRPASVTPSAAAVAASITAGVHNTLLANPALLSKAKGKAFDTPPEVDPAAVASKSFWDDLGSIASDMLPVVINALSKDYKAPTGPTVPSYLAEDKDFWDFLGGTLETVVPQVISAISGDKEYQAAPPPQVPAGKPKSWFSDAMGVVGDVLPTVLPIVMAAL